MNDLHDRLIQAADDRGTPLRTDLPSLLERARAARHRRARATGAAALLTGVAVVGTTLGVRAALPDSPDRSADPDRRTPRTSAPAPAPVPADEIVRRCQPQLVKYAANPMYVGIDQAPPRALGPAHPERAYVPGEVVAIRDSRGGSNPAMCLLPEKGQEQDPVPFGAFDPARATPERVRQLCGENLGAGFTFDYGTNELVPLDEVTPDLRDARILASDATGPVVAAALELGGKPYACYLSPVTWDSGITQVEEAVRAGFQLDQANGTSGSSNKSIVDETASWYLGAGRMPAGAATIELLFQDAGPVRIPVTDGGYAFVHKVPGPGGLQPNRNRVLDADGNVLGEQPDFQ